MFYPLIYVKLFLPNFFMPYRIGNELKCEMSKKQSTAAAAAVRRKRFERKRKFELISAISIGTNSLEQQRENLFVCAHITAL
jgi:hypothetical protein